MSKALVAILAVTFLTGWALYLGHNAALLISSIAVIGGLGGYAVGRRKK